MEEFQSTPSVWRETTWKEQGQVWLEISIHSLRVEGDHRAQRAASGESISIHSLRVEGDASDPRYMSMPWNFNPLPPCGGRLCNRVFPALYHYFNPLPPCGGRHGLPPLGFSDFPISIHSLRVEGDSGGVPEGLSAVISIHSLRVEGDLHQGNQSRPGAISIHSLRVEGDG